MDKKDFTIQNIFYFVATIGVVGILFRLYGAPILPWQQGFPGWAAADGVPMAPGGVVPGAGTTENVSTTTVIGGAVAPTVSTSTSSATSPQFVVDTQMNFNFNGVTGNLAQGTLPLTFGGMNGVPGYSVVSCVGGSYLVNIYDGSGNQVRTVQISSAGSY